MKSLLTVLSAFLESRTSRTNLKTLLKLMLVLFLLITLFSGLFHVLMEAEGREFSWITGLYWTMTVMTSLGFGDITFTSDLGRLFSILVLGSGVVFMLVLLPFTFIEFFYAPWMRAQANAKAPRELPESIRQHVLFTQYDAVSAALLPLLEKYGHPCVMLCPTLQEALELDGRGLHVALGDLDDPETYRRIEHAALLVTTRSDVINTNVTFAVRQLSEHLPIVASAGCDASRDVLELAGATLILRLEEMMGSALARHISIRNSNAHVIGDLDGLLIAEASASGTDLVGSTLQTSRIRNRTGASVIGIWHHGRLRHPNASLKMDANTVLILAGTRAQLDRFDSEFTSASQPPPRVLIIGGGRVGRATSRALQELGIHSVLIEKIAERVAKHPEAVIGDAMHLDVLKQAGAREATTVIITTHDDDTNVALTIFFRRLRSNWQILARSTLDRHVETLRRAGADLVLSYASMGANTILNVLRGDDKLLLAEGISVFPSSIPASMAGRRLGDLHVRSETGCTIVALEQNGQRIMSPGPDERVPDQGTVILVGTLAAEEKFLDVFKPELEPPSRRKKRR
jgi:voltage-gated potassium channel